ncbi:MAG TPA: hypothetical protein VHR66_09780 [Gemmataceae bacterium]|jgi:hypothetical protein|nr:hypothetical protein [Gemmataceae bacterium]
MIEVRLVKARGGSAMVRELLADSGAGTNRAGFELLLDQSDCQDCGGLPVKPIILGGAYSGTFPVYLIRVQIPALGFDRRVRAVGASRCPSGFEGIACFRFLSRFHYGNFADPEAFGLET